LGGEAHLSPSYLYHIHITAQFVGELSKYTYMVGRIRRHRSTIKSTVRPV